MALSDSQRKSLIQQIAQSKKRIVDIQAKAIKAVAAEEKKILDAESKLNKG